MQGSTLTFSGNLSHGQVNVKLYLPELETYLPNICIIVHNSKIFMLVTDFLPAQMPQDLPTPSPIFPAPGRWAMLG